MPANHLARHFVLLLVLSCGTAFAAEPAVHAVQPPAWIERAGGVVALRPGDPLLAGDVIRTGPGGRVQVDLPEGSRIKLGERVEFRAERVRETTDARGGLFDAAFNVLKGAFRFTTGLAGQDRRRDVTFQVGVVTAGIRGTDIWGKSADDGSNMVLLLEGEVELAMPGHESMMLATPARGVMMMPSGEMRMMEAMPGEMLRQYAQETEMNPERAMMAGDGAWQLIVMSLRDHATAERVQAQLVGAGYPAEVLPVRLETGEWYRVALTHLMTARDARMQGDALDGRFGIDGYWVRRDAP